MFFENYVRLCNSVGKTPSAVALEMGIAKPTVTRWKNGSTPNSATLYKVADYFGVSTGYLLGEEQDEKSPAPKGAELTPEQIMAIEKIKNMPPEELDKKMPALVAVLDM